MSRHYVDPADESGNKKKSSSAGQPHAVVPKLPKKRISCRSRMMPPPALEKTLLPHSMRMVKSRSDQSLSPLRRKKAELLRADSQDMFAVFNWSAPDELTNSSEVEELRHAHTLCRQASMLRKKKQFVREKPKRNVSTDQDDLFEMFSWSKQQHQQQQQKQRQHQQQQQQNQQQSQQQQQHQQSQPTEAEKKLSSMTIDQERKTQHRAYLGSLSRRKPVHVNGWFRGSVLGFSFDDDGNGKES